MAPSYLKIYKVDRRLHTLTNIPHELITEDQKSILVDGYLLWRTENPILFVEAIRTGQNAVERLQDLYLSSSGIIISTSPSTPLSAWDWNTRT